MKFSTSTPIHRKVICEAKLYVKLSTLKPKHSKVVCEVVNIEPKHIYVVCEVVNSEVKTHQSCMWSCQHWSQNTSMWSCQHWSQNTSTLYVKLSTVKSKHIKVVCEVANIEAKTHQHCMWSCQHWSQNTAKLYVKLPTLKPKHSKIVCEPDSPWTENAVTYSPPYMNNNGDKPYGTVATNYKTSSLTTITNRPHYWTKYGQN